MFFPNINPIIISFNPIFLPQFFLWTTKIHTSNNNFINSGTKLHSTTKKQPNIIVFDRSITMRRNLARSFVKWSRWRDHSNTPLIGSPCRTAHVTLPLLKELGLEFLVGSQTQDTNSIPNRSGHSARATLFPLPSTPFFLHVKRKDEEGKCERLNPLSV